MMERAIRFSTLAEAKEFKKIHRTRAKLELNTWYRYGTVYGKFYITELGDDAVVNWVRFKSEEEIVRFILDNDVDTGEIEFPLEVNKLYKVVDDTYRENGKGFWIEAY